MEGLEVECAVDGGGEAVPTRFGWRGARRDVVEVLDRWLGEGHRYFRVRDETGAVCILRHDTERGGWSLHSLRSDP